MIRTLLVDLDGTLHDNGLRLARQAQSVMGDFGVSADETSRAYFAAHDRIHQEFPDRHDDIPFHFQLMGEVTGRAVSSERAMELARLWQRAYDDYQASPQMFDDVRPFLETMRSRGIRLVLVSGSTEQERRRLLQVMGVETFFTDVFAANSVGYQKKDPRFYDHVLKALGISPYQTAVVGDSMDDDVSAKRQGIMTFLLVRGGKNVSAGEWQPDHVVHSLSEVPPLLGKNTGRKKIWTLYAVSVAVRFAVFALILGFVGAKGFELGDSAEYLGLAHSLLNGQGFALNGAPFFIRTIGYPLFLAGGLAVFRSTTGFVLFQLLIAALIPLAVLKLGKQLRLGRNATWIAAWFAALEPHLVYYGVTILTESVYTLLLLVALIYVFKAMESKRFRDSLVAGVAFGVGMLIKPLLQFFPVALLVVASPWAKRIAWRKALTHTLVILAVVGIICAPWMYRNYRTFGSFTLSSQGSAAALLYLGTSIVSVRDHITYQDAEAEVRSQFAQSYGTDLTAAQENKTYGTAALGYIKTYPGILFRLLAINTLTFWTSSNYNAILNTYQLTPPVDHSVLPPTHYLVQGRFADFFGAFWQIFSQPFYIIGAIGRLLWFVVTLLFLYGLLAAYRRIPDRRFQWLFLVALCLYLTATVWVDGLGIEARLRYPLMPIEFLYMAYGTSILRSRRTPPAGKLRVLVTVQAMDENDSLFGFFVRWVGDASPAFAKMIVLALRVGEYHVPANVEVIPMRPRGSASKLRALWTIWSVSWKRRHEYDVVYVRSDVQYVIAAYWLWWLLGKRVVLWYTHHVAHPLLYPAGVLADATVTAAPESMPHRKVKAIAIGHGLDAERFALHPIDPARLRVLVFGRIMPSKHILELIDAFRASTLSSKATLDIIGPAVDAEYTERVRVATDGLANVTLKAEAVPYDEVPKLLQSYDILLNANVRSLDKIIIESMLSGVVPISSTDAQHAALSDDLQWLVAQTPDAWRAAMDRLAAMDKAGLEALAGELRRSAVSMHSASAQAARLDAVLRGDKTR